MAVGDFEVYYDQNPIAAWDRNRWTVYDPAINVAFRTNSLLTPMVNWTPLEAFGGGNAPTVVTGREALPGHSNHNTIDVRAKYINAAYMDSRERRITAPYHYGGKVQLDSYDSLINMWQNGGAQGFIDGILRQHLANDIVTQHEKIARDMILTHTNVKTYANGAANFSAMSANSAYLFDPTVLRDMKLRLSFRSMFALQQYGEYAQPLPGMNEGLIMTTPGVFHSIWDNLNHEYIQRLNILQDKSILNGSIISYEGFNFMESHLLTMWNCGAITKQVAVTAPITAGDGAPDPDSTTVDSTWYVGQSSSGLTHYVQCSDLGTSQFAAGDIVTLHTARTASWGVTDGVDITDGDTMTLEVLSVDENNERLTFRQPVMADFPTGTGYTTLAGSGSVGTGYAFITKAMHVHPMYVFGARGGSTFAIRRPVQLHMPQPVDDFESVWRVSWDEYGGPNKWNGDLAELHFVAGSFGNRGSVGIV